MKKQINNVLRLININPVLIDIGASSGPPKIWDTISPKSIYLGFDPDLRAIQDIPDGKFKRSIILNVAASSDTLRNEIEFYLTHSPYCSSTLPPDNQSLANYLFSDLFVTEKKVTVRCCSLNAVIDRLQLGRVDWFKTDSQGTDLRLFQSLRDDLRNGVLAVDIEPGLIDAYQGEDLFVDAHSELLHQGFWLSKLNVRGTVRMQRNTLESIARNHPKCTDTLVYSAVKPSPGWCEASYLRTLESLKNRKALPRDYALLWVFAILEKQWGYGLDIALSYEAQFGPDDISKQMRDFPLKQIYSNESFRSVVKRLLPQQAQKLIKKLIQA